MLLAVMCEKKAIPDPDGWEKSCNSHMEKYYYNCQYSWNQHNPTVGYILFSHTLYLHIQLKIIEWHTIEWNKSFTLYKFFRDCVK